MIEFVAASIADAFLRFALTLTKEVKKLKPKQ